MVRPDKGSTWEFVTFENTSKSLMEDISSFIQKIEGEIDGLAPGSLKPATHFRELPEWSSMHALVLIALSETEYNVTLTGEDLRKCGTVQEIYDLISSRT